MTTLTIILIVLGVCCLCSVFSTLLSKTTYLDTIGIATTVCLPSGKIIGVENNSCTNIKKVYYYIDNVEYNQLTTLPFNDNQQVLVSYNSNNPSKAYLEGENVPNNTVGIIITVLCSISFFVGAYLEYKSNNK